MTHTADAGRPSLATRLLFVAATPICYVGLVTAVTWLAPGGPGGFVFWPVVLFSGLLVGSISFARRSQISLWWAALTILASVVIWFLVAFTFLIIALSNLEMD